MTTVDTGRECLDLKKMWKWFVHKIWIVIAAAIAGAIIGVLAYIIYSNVMGKNQVYEIRNDYYITFNNEEFSNSVDYYNAYTWDSILRDDPIVNYALSKADSVSKDDILATVSGEMLSDYRILTVSCKGTNQDKVRAISDAYKEAVPHFAEEIDMLKKIELWTDGDIAEYDEYTRDGNAAVLGALIMLLISTVVLLFIYLLDDGIYTEADWVKRYPEIPFLGEEDSDECKINSDHILGNLSAYYVFDVNDFEFNADIFNKLREEKGIVLKIKKGIDKADKIEKVMFTLRKQHIKVVAMMLSVNK